MLKELHLRGVGPAPKIRIEFADRLNIFTGDNGLGKSFLLDVAWWVLTGNWTGQPAYPQRGSSITPEITCQLANSGQSTSSIFDFSAQKWQHLQITPEWLVIYVRTDGAFSLFDPARQPDRAYNFTPDTLWNGLRSGEKVLCNGLIQDWVKWQHQPDRTTFELLDRILRQLAPQESEWMSPGEPTRVDTEDVRDIPTINFPYGNLPVIYTSSGMKRILGLAYLLVWTWYEHVQASKLRNQDPNKQIILLIDEVESHLHPRWQRAILPAILEVVTQLQSQMNLQALVTTHSPLVLASLEAIFDAEDRLFLFDLSGEAVNLKPITWTKQGDIVGWLTSEIFGLKQARSREAELAIAAASAWMRNGNMNEFPADLRTPAQIHQQLLELLPGHDPFWPRWVVTREARQL
ncbi:MAG: AAA family ATPase [Hormoscilla sp.]